MNRHERRRAASFQRKGITLPQRPVQKQPPWGSQPPVSPALAEATRKQALAFRAKFGRDPKPGDPIFFDPDAPGPEPVALSPAAMKLRMADQLRAAGVKEHFVRAFLATGRIVTPESASRLTPEQAMQWRKAIDESIVQLRIERGAYDPETGK